MLQTPHTLPNYLPVSLDLIALVLEVPLTLFTVQVNSPTISATLLALRTLSYVPSIVLVMDWVCV